MFSLAHNSSDFSICRGREKASPICYIGVEKKQALPLNVMYRVGKKQELDFPYPYLLYRRREKVRS